MRRGSTWEEEGGHRETAEEGDGGKGEGKCRLSVRDMNEQCSVTEA